MVEVPAEVVEALGGKGRIPVRAAFDGVAYEGSIVRMGGRPILGMLKAVRKQLSKSIGDAVEVTVALDSGTRTVTVPPDLESALREDGAALAAFQKLSYSHQREYMQWIEEANRSATRERRIRSTIDRVRGS